MTATATRTATEHLAVIFPRGATVTVVVTDQTRNRAGTSRTTMVVLGTQDGQITDVSGLAATLTGSASTWAADARRQVVVLGYGIPAHAARALVCEISTALHGSDAELHTQVLSLR